ncbi:MAG: hypothetical protein WBA68_06990 [Alteraurantiacibacter sp.]
MNEKSSRLLIVIDIEDLSIEHLQQLVVFVKHNKLFDDWHSPFAGTFIVSSRADYREIALSMHEFFPEGRRLLVTHLVLGNNNGFLAKQSWDWISQFRQSNEPKEQ